MADGSAAHTWDGPLRARWTGFARWWLAGLRATVPATWRDRFGAAGPTLLLVGTSDGCLCRAVVNAERGGPPKTGRSGPEALASYLADAGLRRDEVTVAVLIDRPLFFTRSIDLPDAAMAALPRLLDQDILRRTPFPIADVRHGATPTSAPSSRRGVTSLRHWIIRRDLVEAVLATAALAPDGVDVLFTTDDDGQEIPVIPLGPAVARDPPWARRALAVAAGAAFLVTMAGLLAVDQRQQSTADRLAAELADMRAKIHGPDGVTDAVGLRTVKADVGMTAILNELSTVMPDDTFLTELRVGDGKVEAAGFSGDAARLVRLADGSPLFKGAALAGAIEPNATEGKDHFTLDMTLRTGQMLRLRAEARRAQATPADEPPS